MLSIEQRCNICLMAEKNKNWTQLQLARWAYEAFKLPKIPSQGAISRLLAKREVYMNCKDHQKGAIRIRNPTNVLVRRVLQEWISQSLWNGIPITIPILQQTAQSVWHKLAEEHREGDGSFSSKWINTCLSKMGLDIADLTFELPKMPKVWSFEERDILKNIFAQLPPNNVFTLDETCLAYDLPLDYAQYDTNDTPNKIDVATVMLCSNLDGSEKLNPLVIGKYDSYISFRNYFPDQPTDRVSEALLGQKMAMKFNISFHSNRKAWLTSSLFHDWLVSWDKRLVADNRKIWIVLDDSVSHRIINSRLKNIQLIYTSSSSKFLPFNWGVLDEFIIRYRIKQYKALINLQKKLEQKMQTKVLMNPEQSKLTMSNALKFIRESWNEVSSDSIKSSWKCSGILPAYMSNSVEDRRTAFRKSMSLIQDLDFLCDQFYCVEKWDHDLLLNLNIENKNTNFLSIEELIECSVVEKCEKNPVGTVPQKTPENFVFTPSESSTITSTTSTATNNNNISANSVNETSLPVPNTESSAATFGSNSNLTSPFEVTLHSLLNANTSLPENKQYNVSNLIDKPALFSNSAESLELTKSPVNMAVNNDEFINTIIDSKMSLGVSSEPETLHQPQPRVLPIASNSASSQMENQIPNFGMAGINRNIYQKIPPTNELSPQSFPEYDGMIGKNNSLLINIDIAKSLGSILRNVVSNELYLSQTTINEIKEAYDSVLETISSSRNSNNASRQKRPNESTQMNSQPAVSSLQNSNFSGTYDFQNQNEADQGPSKRFKL
ncbi:hypothetical protein Kpol_1032p43 [Vanderwaltozyma polyspora DSM 70294]|uniref:HTH CENPB-type domain-containing protein n=1 Tax=Vanderwaltozyma polyspora (strain ATCC 22028 / DSM 70294 / BCRC 21397 / CBS 2163 / NBRC 10782 / NRRL Y-8283 / UCD 57-17) TaxID=436907 RepID=A7TGZ7_VANPO|nr:uncharacterized protein Kpol_1032p43 [Vanderwaltozyma polyspora DSM 70294]EDO18449.1 hypothetical protein Kpol_1032p43 [Vanderwaltozyma polyspora DSM 70294]